MANIPRIYNSKMELQCVLDNAINIGYKQKFNDLWTATFTLPADDPKNKYCNPFHYVEIYDEGERVELFRILPIELKRSKKGFRTYKCEHVIATLIDNVMFRYHQIGNIGVFTRSVVNFVLGFQRPQANWVLGRCDFNHQFLYKWENENLCAALFSIPRPFMDEWHFTYDTTVFPWVFNLVRADDMLGCEVRYGKNMQEITKLIDPTNLVTRIYPLGYGEGDNQLTIESVNNGIPFLEADTIDTYGLKEVIWTDRRFEDAQSLKDTAWTMLEKLKTPYISYNVESIDLFKKTRQEFDRFREGKRVRVIDKLDGINVETRIVEIEKVDVTKADINITIANKDRNVAGSIAAMQERARIHETYAQGSETLIMIPYADNCEPNFPGIFDFFIPQHMVNINQAFLRLRVTRFRANSRAVGGGGGTTATTTAGGGTTATSSNGGATTQSTTNGGGTTQSTTQQAQQTPTTSTNAQQTPTTSVQAQQAQTTQDGGATTSGASSASTTASAPALASTWRIGGNSVPDSMTSAGDPAHRHMITATPWMPEHSHNMQHTHTITAHSHSFTIPAHSHTVTIPSHSHTVTIPAHAHSVTIPAHSHSVTIPAHSHTVTIEAHSHNVTIPNHTHAIEFGIFEGTAAQQLSIRVDGNLIPINMQQLDHIDIRPFLSRDGGGRIRRNTWHRLEIVPDRMTRINAQIFLNIFTNSRGGGTD